PAESMRRRSPKPCASARCRNTPSASGERQMLPRHTNSTPILPSLIAYPFALSAPCGTFPVMSIRLAAFVLGVLLGACRAGTDACSAPVRVADLPAPLDEASGVAVSRSPNGPVWVHNDSEGTAMLYALDRAGSPVAEIALPEAGAQFDWEDIAVGPCPDGDCIYIGDIGDNLHRRDDRAILRLAEPRIDAPDRAI